VSGKALFATWVRRERVTLLRLLHPENAQYPIVVTEAGMLILVRLIHP
jgi:hypothetical protein